MSDRRRLRTMAQRGPHDSPWPGRHRLLVALWHLVYLFLFLPSPKPLNPWRLLLLRLFGARVHRSAFVAPSARIRIPWFLEMEERACIGDRADVYNLGRIRLGARSTVAQEVMLCGGSHDFSSRRLPLVVGPIIVGEDAFVCARAIILPGVFVRRGAVVAAGAVVTKDVPAGTVVGGNPARIIRRREWKEEEA